MATSRGVVLAMVSGAGGWLLWRFIQLTAIRQRVRSEAVFPALLLVYLCAVAAFLYAGPARSAGISPGNDEFGDGSRGELFARSLYLLQDYPFTGGGLGAFPGLYSQYLLNIPFFNVPNSHNLFLDVGIEQGMPGGLSFLSLYLLSLWVVSNEIAKGRGKPPFKWVVLYSLIVAIVHGMVDDYLYNGAGTALALLLVGLSMNRQAEDNETVEKKTTIRTAGIVVIIGVIIALAGLNQLRGAWYANFGAVQLAKVELDGFPNTGWAGPGIIPRLDAADASLRASLEFDPASRTANQRLGMIAMLRRDFESAAGYLETAHALSPGHRGVVKSLAYCYVWLGNMDGALALLPQIPEAREELDVYIWWWETQGQSGLSENARLALNVLENSLSQP
jgi:tetratricopeptide (TPR) repeat protein